MRHSSITGSVPALALVLAFAAAAWADCAPYISTGINDPPGVGTLIGTETRTEVVRETIEIVVSGSGSGASGSVKRTITRETTRSYQVGTYLMSDGSRVRVDCSTYRYI